MPESFICGIVAPHLADLLSPRRGEEVRGGSLDPCSRGLSRRTDGSPTRTLANLPPFGSSNGDGDCDDSVGGGIGDGVYPQPNYKRPAAASSIVGKLPSLDETLRRDPESTKPPLSRITERHQPASCQVKHSNLAGADSRVLGSQLPPLPGNDSSPRTGYLLQSRLGALHSHDTTTQQRCVYTVGPVQSSTNNIPKYPGFQSEEGSNQAVPPIARRAPPKHPNKLSVIDNSEDTKTMMRMNRSRRSRILPLGARSSCKQATPRLAATNKRVDNGNDEFASWRARAELFRIPDKCE